MRHDSDKSIAATERQGPHPWMRRYACGLVSVLVLAGTSGCVHLEQEIRIRTSGAVVCQYRYSVASESIHVIESGRRIIEQWQSPANEEQGLNWFFNEQAARRHFQDSGLHVKGYHSYEKGGRHHVALTVVGEDIRRAIAGGALGPFVLERTGDGNVVLRADPPDGGTGDLNAGEILHLRELFADLRLRLSIRVPTRIVQTSAPTFSGRTVAWEFDPAQSTAFLQNPPVIDVVFSGNGLDW